MTMKFAGYANLNGIDSEWKGLTDTRLKFYDLGDLHRRLRSKPIHLVARKLKESGLVEAARFPVANQAPKLILERIAHYDSSTHQIKMPNDEVPLMIDRNTMQNCFWLLVRKVFS